MRLNWRDILSAGAGYKNTYGIHEYKVIRLFFAILFNHFEFDRWHCYMRNNDTYVYRFKAPGIDLYLENHFQERF